MEDYLHLANRLPESMFFVAPDGYILATNSRAREQFGKNVPLVGHSLFDLVTGSPDALRDYLKSCLRTSSPLLGTLTLRNGAQSPASFRAEGCLLRPPTQNSPALLMLRVVTKDSVVSRFRLLNERIEDLSHEVFARKRAEDQLLQHSELLRVTLQSIGDAVIATDTQGNVSLLNSVAQRLTGWTEEEALGHPLPEVFRIINEHTRHSVENPVDKVFRERVIVGLANHTLLLHKDGSERPIDDSGAPIEGQDGRLHGAVLVFRDVSERKHAESQREELLANERRARSQAERANRLKDEFLSTISHELRTPLNAILGWAQVLLQDQSRKEGMLEGLRVIERNSRAQARIIEELLDMSRIISGKFRLDVQSVDLAKLTEETIESLQPSIDAKQICIRRLLDTASSYVRGDEARLRQVIWNLLSNSVKFTPKGGAIEIVVRKRGSQLEWAITDTGEGMRSDFLPYVFDRFSQEESSITRKHGGLGIGLAIVKNIVDMHGGSITASSPGENLGATFTLHLPMQTVLSRTEIDEREKANPQGACEEAGVNLQGVRVLVVDDEADSGVLVKRVLEACGAEAVVTDSADGALNALASGQFDVLLSDIGMPSKDGYELMKEVRSQLSAYSQIPAAALTAFARSEDRRRALQAGFQSHLAKPVEPAELVTVVAMLARRTGSST